MVSETSLFDNPVDGPEMNDGVGQKPETVSVLLPLPVAGPWTYGALANHLWSFAKEDRTEINASFLQPFVSYITPTKLTFYLNTAPTSNWHAKEWVWDEHENTYVRGRYFISGPAIESLRSAFSIG